MEKDDLLRMLDLSGKELPPEVAKEITDTTDNDSPLVEQSPTALEMDDWGLRRGREVLETSERMQATELDEHAVADFYAASFEPEPKLQEGCVDPRRHEFVSQLLQTPDYLSLHTVTMLNAVASEIAAVTFAEQFAELTKKESKHEEGKGAESHPEMETLRAVGRAIGEAGKEVEECKDAAAAFGMGPGSPGSNDAKAIASLFKAVRSNSELRRICELAGRYRRMAQSKQRQKTTHGMDDMVGVMLDGDVGKLLPQELVRLTDDDLGDDAMRRLVERQLMCREYKGVEPVARGPILVCLDESGSMSGEKIQTAKALALALAWIARMQKRWCGLVSYSGDSGERVLALPPDRWDEAALLDWLKQFIGMGSSIDVPVRELPRFYREIRAPAGKTDVIFVTDAICHLPFQVQAAFQEWKQTVKARLITLVIQSEAGDLAGISDEVHLVRTLSVDEWAIEEVLSI